MPRKKLSSHPLETLNGVRGVQGVRNTLAGLAQEFIIWERRYSTILVPGGGLVEESTERDLGHVCCK